MSNSFPKGEPLSWNMEAIGYTDLDRRPGFKMAIHKAGDRWYLYVAHLWHSGFSVIEITDAATPRVIRFVAGPPNTWTLQVQVADGLMITSQERVPEGWGTQSGGAFGEGFVIWNLADPENPKELGILSYGREGHPPEFLRRRPLRSHDRPARGL